MARAFIWLFCIVSAVVPPWASATDLQVRVQNAAGAPLANAVVYAIPAPIIAHDVLRHATIDQLNKQFVPRASVIRVGTSVSLPNSDQIHHSVYSFSPAKVFTLNLYAGKAAAPVLFDKAGVVVLGCNIHDQMVAWVLVLDTPFYTRTDESGAAELKGLPPGEYTLRAWHAPMQQEEAGEALRLEATPPAPLTLRIKGDTGDTRDVPVLNR